MTRRTHWAAGLTVLLAALLAAFALCSPTGPRGARAGEATGDDYVYLRTDVLADADHPDNPNLPCGQSGAIIYTDTYSGGGAGVVNPIVLLQKDGDYVEYAFDLADAAETAVLSLNIGGSRRVEVKAAGESEFVKLTTASPAGNRSFEFYDLTEADALKSADNKFTLRVSFDSTVPGGGVVLRTVTVQTAPPVLGKEALKEGLNLDPFTENEAKFVYAGGNVTRYFAGTDPTTHIPGGQFVTYRFVFDASVEKVAIAATNVGEALKLEVSADNKAFAALPANGIVDVAKDKTLYLKASSEAGDTFLKTLGMAFVGTKGVGVNGNRAVPADSADNFFLVGTAAEKAQMFGLTDAFETNFATTHSGLVKDGYEGSYDLHENARKLTAGQYLVYDFDLPDDVKSAHLTMRAIAGMAVSVSTDEGETFTALATDKKPQGSSDRGHYSFALTEEDALAGADNKFRLLVEAASESYFFGAGVFSDDYALDAGVYVNPETMSDYKYLVDTKNTKSYYANNAYPNWFMSGADAYLVYRFELPDTVSRLGVGLLVTACGGGETVLVSADGTTYSDDLLSVKVGGSGTPPMTAVALGGVGVVKDSRTLYVKLTAKEGAGAFIADFALAFAGAGDEVSGTVRVNSDAEAEHLYGPAMLSANGQAEASDKESGAVPYRQLEPGAFVTYRLDLVDAAAGMRFRFANVSGNYAVAVSAKPDAGFTTILSGNAAGEKETAHFNVFDRNERNVVYVRVTNTATDAWLVYSGFSYTTEDLPERENSTKPYEDGDVDFDYDKEVPGVADGDRPVLDDPLADPDPVIVSTGKGGCNAGLASFAAVLSVLGIMALGGKRL